MSYDQLVNDFVLSKFRDHWGNHDFSRSFLSAASIHALKHQVSCETSRADVKRCEWECGCLSEYTREDVFVVKFIISCDCGSYYRVVTSLSDVAGEDIIRQLEEFESTWECSIDDEFHA